MPSRNETVRARKQLQLAAPICDDARLVKLKEEIAEFLQEAKRQDLLKPDELASTVLDEVARRYFRHVVRKQARVTPLRRRKSP